MAEYKWLYGNGHAGPAVMHGKNVEGVGELSYLTPKRDYGYFEGYDKPNSEGTNSLIAYNFVCLFRPEDILPTLADQGAGTDKLVGNKFRWKNTTLRITLASEMQDFYTKVGPSNIKYISDPSELDSYTITLPAQEGRSYDAKSHAETELANGTLIDDSKWYSGGTFTNAGVWTGFAPITGHVGIIKPNAVTAGEITDFKTNVDTKSTGAILLSAVNGSITRDGPWNSDYNLHGSTLTRVGNQMTGMFPLYRHPQIRFYYYCRILIVKMKMSYTDWNAFSNMDSYASFLNALWWKRKSAAGNELFSIRDPDLAIPNPFAKTFRIVFNKCYKINPFKGYNFDINLKSYYPNQITIKEHGPYVTEGNYDLYENGCYIGFLLPPSGYMTDFDDVTANMLQRSTTYNLAQESTPSGEDRLINPALQPLVAPYDTLYTGPTGGFRFGTRLKLATYGVRSRTCFLD